MDSEIFQGNALNAVDAKGRLSLPSFIRTERDRGPDPRTVRIGVDESGDCLTAFGLPYLEYMLSKLERRELKGEDAGIDFGDDLEDASVGVFGMTERLTYDSSGRISLTNLLRDEGRIEDLALFVGRGRYAQIWNPRIAIAKGAPRLKRIAEYYLAQRGAK